MTTGQSSTGSREASLLLELSRTVTSTLDLQEVLDQSFAALRQLIDFGGGAIQLIEDEHLVAAATDPPAKPEALTVRIPVGQGVSGTIAATGETIYIADIAVDERVHPEGRKKGLSEGVRSYFGAPLIVGGQPIGVVQVDSPRVDGFSDTHRALVLAFLPTIAMAVQNAQLFQAEIDTVARLQELERLKRDFLAVVSHELRTPATTIIGFADLLASDPPVVADDEVRALASRIALAGRHLTILIDDLLDVAGLSRGNFRIDLREVSVAEVVADVVDARSWQTHEIRVEVADNLPPVIADYLRLNQVLSNLVSNAMKFSTSGSPITISAVADDGHVTIAVADRGVGIPTAEQERIFERFYQVDQSLTREAGGLGIGLFLARQLCQRMGAAIALESEPGAGSRFTVRLRQAGPPD